MDSEELAENMRNWLDAITGDLECGLDNAIDNVDVSEWDKAVKNAMRGCDEIGSLLVDFVESSEED